MKVSIKDIESARMRTTVILSVSRGIIHIRLLRESIRFEYEFSTAVLDSGLERSCWFRTRCHPDRYRHDDSMRFPI